MKPSRQPFVRFCTDVLRLALSPAWRVLLNVAIDGVEPYQLDGEDRELARILFGDVDTIPAAARLALVARIGRGGGKTTYGAALGLWLMITADLTGVGPGMLAAAVTIAPTKKTALISVRVARELARSVPDIERMIDRDGDTTEGFYLSRGGRRVAFVAVAASRGGASLRGFDIIGIVFDESEFFSSNDDTAAADGYAVSDRDLYAAAKPRLHGPALFISTPWPSENLTAELFDRNFGHPVDALAALGSSTLMRPDDARLAQAVVQEMARDPDNAQREYFCQPGARGGSRLFDPDAIDSARDEDRALVIEAPAGSVVGAGGDLGLERDSSAIAIVSRKDGAYDLLETDEIRPAKGAPLTPGYVIRDRFAPVMRRYNVSEITMDAHYRMSATEHLDALRLRFRDAPTGIQGKYDSHMFTRALLHAGKLRLGPSPRVAAQLKAVSQTPISGGGTRITSPRRAGQGHGDVVSALVLGVWAAQLGANNTLDLGADLQLFHSMMPRGRWEHDHRNDDDWDESEPSRPVAHPSPFIPR